MASVEFCMGRKEQRKRRRATAESCRALEGADRESATRTSGGINILRESPAAGRARKRLNFPNFWGVNSDLIFTFQSAAGSRGTPKTTVISL